VYYVFNENDLGKTRTPAKALALERHQPMMKRHDELTRQTHKGLQQARTLMGLSDEDLRLTVARAVGERDHDTLWAVTETHLLRKNASKHTISSYRKGVMTLLEAWSGVDLLRPRTRDAELYVLNLQAPDREADPADLQARGERVATKALSPASVRQRVAAARAFYEALRWSGATTADPFADVVLPHLTSRAADRAREKAYTQDEVERMARACQDWDDRLILLLGAHAGLRVSEMLEARWEDVDLHESRITIRFGKGGVTASVTMSDELTHNLRTLRHGLFPAGHATGRLLETRSRSHAYNRMQRLWIDGFTQEGLEVPPFEKGVHGLRHYAGVTYARETQDLRKVRDHLRHATMSSTEIYMAAAEDTDEVRDWTIGLDD
jgi:integrase/recombinase XerC